MAAKRILTCESIAQAYLLKGRLANEGIDSFLTNENFTNLFPLYNNMLGSGIQLMIDEKDEVEAKKILKEYIEPNNVEMICPYCGSQNIVLGLGRNKGFKILNMLIAILAFLPLGHIKPKYYCKDCNKEIK